MGLATTIASAAISVNFNVDNSIPGISGNNITVNTTSDFLSAVMLIELTAGTIHNPNSFVPGVETFFNAFPGDLDTFVSANGNPSVGIAGGAGDLDASAPAAATFGPTLLGVAWFSPGADTDDIGNGLPIGSFVVTDDAAGTWQLLVFNSEESQVFSGALGNGWIIPETASLGLLTLGGLALLRRGR